MSALKKYLVKFKNRLLSLSWKKKIVLLVVIVGIIIFFITQSQARKPSYTTEKVTRGTVTDEVSESGNVEAAAQFDVFSPTTGFIEEVFVENGETVTDGQALFKVKSTATEKEKAEASTNLLQAQSTLGQANATMYSLQSDLYSNWKVFQDLATNSTYQNSDGSAKNDSRNLPEFTTAQADWLAAEALYKNQKSTVTAAQAALNSAKLSYDATQNATVKSPTSGTIANITAQPGEKITAKDASSTKNVPEMVVGDFTRNIINIDLNEVDINKVQPNQSVKLVFDAARDKTYKGIVTSVNSVGNNNAGVITYSARIAMNDTDTKVKPGMTVTVTIETQKNTDTLTVPNSAVKPYAGGKAVLVPGTGKDKKVPYHYVPVKIGIKGVTRTEILSGIGEGETVITNAGTLQKPTQ